tara:strand:- start:7119 stop:8294 length:1176 start_codon:yes stop_codon:yes gene_type:complete
MTQKTDALTQALLCHYQRDFPLVSKPFQLIAESLGSNEQAVLEKLNTLKEVNVLTRIGPIFDHKRAGASLLAAVSVPEQQGQKIAEIINRYPEVNHNYGREHVYNLWFVVTAPDKTHLDETLVHMEKAIGFSILRLPMVKSYYIDLGFQLSHERLLSKTGHLKGQRIPENLNVHHLAAPPSIEKIDSSTLLNEESLNEESLNDELQNEALLCEMDQHRLRSLIQDGLPLSSEPFKLLADQLGFVTEQTVLSTLKYWLKIGLVKRIGLVTNHHQLGYTSNAMVVWNVPDDKIDKMGELIKESGLVSLCYQRQRHLPEWSFNLYCMVHSRKREHVEGVVQRLSMLAGLQDMPREILFTTQQHKQKGGLYSIYKKSNKPGNHPKHHPLLHSGVA